jgi:hypothetical protein
MMKFKSTLFLVCALFITSSVFTQGVPDVVWKSPMTKVVPTGEYLNLPIPQDQLTYENPNKTTRVIYTGQEILVLPPNVRPFPHAATQSEVDVANMTGNGSIIWASWNSYLMSPSTFYGTGFCYSSNGGNNWTGNFQMFTPNSGDPAPWVWPAGSTWAGRLGISVISHASYSTNGGTTWSTPVAFSPGGGSAFDKNFSAVDDVSGSPYFGRAYTVWTDFSGTQYRIRISYTTDGGVTWSPSTYVSPPPSAGHHHQGCDVKVGPSGHVHVVWANCTTNGQNSTEDSLGYARSTDGGVTWVVSVNNAVDMNGIRTSNLFNGIRANGFPRFAIDKTGGPRNGWLYTVAAEKTLAPAGDVADVVMCRSTNNGVTWTRIKVNQDPSNGRFQWFPAVCVTPDGGVNVSYYDQRNTSGFVSEFWLSRSLNGGTSWTDVAVSDHTFTPAPIPGLAGGYQGDYTGISFAAGTGKLYPMWADNSSGVYQVWTDGISYGPPPANDVIVGPFLSLPGSFTVGNNYTIRARVVNGGTNGQTNLPIRFSVNGVIQSTNTIANLPPGAIDSSSFTWNPSTSGSYTLRIFSGAPVDENRNNDTVTTTVTVFPSGTVFNQQTFCRNGLNILIPSVGSAPRDSIVVNIPNTFDVIDVNVRIDTVFHTWVGDLVFNLRRGSANVNFINQVGGSGDNFINTVLNDSASVPISSGSAPFTGTWRPSNPLSALNGQTLNGSWVLGIDDMVAGDSGVLRAWCIQVTYRTLVGGVGYVEIPNYYSLAQNYPNPFNPYTIIKYSVPKAVNVKLTVYDILGKEVAVLVNETKQPGFYEAEFNASGLATGVYFYKIEAGKFNSVKKMMLVK